LLTPSEPEDFGPSPNTLGLVAHPRGAFAGAEDVQGELDTQAAALLLQTDVETTRSKASNTFRHKCIAKHRTRWWNIEGTSAGTVSFSVSSLAPNRSTADTAAKTSGGDDASVRQVRTKKMSDCEAASASNVSARPHLCAMSDKIRHAVAASSNIASCPLCTPLRKR
jgi:hypothetical protein